MVLQAGDSDIATSKRQVHVTAKTRTLNSWTVLRVSRRDFRAAANQQQAISSGTRWIPGQFALAGREPGKIRSRPVSAWGENRSHPFAPITQRAAWYSCLSKILIVCRRDVRARSNFENLGKWLTGVGPMWTAASERLAYCAPRLGASAAAVNPGRRQLRLDTAAARRRSGLSGRLRTRNSTSPGIRRFEALVCRGSFQNSD